MLKLYLATSNTAISVVLVVDRIGKQKPIYFASRALQGAEARYLPLEKLSLSLVFAMQRLHLYFHAHTIHVLSDANLKQVLLKLESSGHLAKWAIKLGEFDIEYHP